MVYLFCKWTRMKLDFFFVASAVFPRTVTHFFALHQYQASTLLQYSQNTHHSTHDEMN